MKTTQLETRPFVVLVERRLKMKKALLVLLVSLFAVSLFAATEVVNGITWTYTVSNGEATVGGGYSNTPAVPTSTTGAITIPATLGGCSVTAIAQHAFYKCRNADCGIQLLFFLHT